jgi:hypothetical protein
MDEQKETRQSWIERPGSTGKLFGLLIVGCVVLLLADVGDMVGVLYHKHVHYAVEKIPGFYAIFGFVAYSLIVGAGWVWRAVVMRKEDYYDA